ncbi:hypothetical protein Moror_5672 [Moniliophthora roreri MCA 2997]|uniref:DUF6593 domain-containing protein n=2 Tax=Moniliophthora roreri TaxID=221103 RepID=V2W7F5_MONRO|nr:hypothetical protein Moror_5672 [Moniliophthora roreri MCA 2997]
MKLHLSQNFLNSTYTDDTGRVIYKVNTPSTPLVNGSTTISKVLPADTDIPRRDSGSDSDSHERFANLGRIDWRTLQSSLIRILDQQMETKQFFRRDGWSGKLFGRNRVFTAPDGKEYKWILDPLIMELVLNDGNDSLVAKYHRGNMGITEEKRRGVLEIYPAGEHMVDLILVTFVYVEKVRLN